MMAAAGSRISGGTRGTRKVWARLCSRLGCYPSSSETSVLLSEWAVGWLLPIAPTNALGNLALLLAGEALVLGLLLGRALGLLGDPLDLFLGILGLLLRRLH